MFFGSGPSDFPGGLLNSTVYADFVSGFSGWPGYGQARLDTLVAKLKELPPDSPLAPAFVAGARLLAGPLTNAAYAAHGSGFSAQLAIPGYMARLSQFSAQVEQLLQSVLAAVARQVAQQVAANQRAAAQAAAAAQAQAAIDAAAAAAQAAAAASQPTTQDQVAAILAGGGSGGASQGVTNLQTSVVGNPNIVDDAATPPRSKLWLLGAVGLGVLLLSRRR